MRIHKAKLKMEVDLDLEKKHWVFFMIIFFDFFVWEEKLNIGSQVLGQTFHNLAQTLQYLAHRYTLTRGGHKEMSSILADL